MSLYHPIVPTRYVAPLIEYLLSESGSSEIRQILNQHGITQELLDSVDASMSIDEFDVLLNHLTRHSQRTDLGFEFGLRINARSYGALGEVWSNCSTVDELLSIASRFSKLMTPGFMLKYRRMSTHNELVWQPAAGMSTLTLQAFYEVHAVALYCLLDLYLGDHLLPYETWFPMSKPPHANRYQQFPKLKVQFQSSNLPEVRSILSHSLTNLPLKLGHTTLGSDIDLLRQMQNSIARRGNWKNWVELILRESENYQPSLAELADLLNISSHTLARRLEEEGQKFRELSNRIRHQRACQMLQKGRYSLDQIASRLGYLDQSNFSHAFKKAEGVTPSQYKKKDQQL